MIGGNIIMTQKEWEDWSYDKYMADHIYKEQQKGKMLDIDIAPIFRAIQKRRCDALMYDIPYTPIFQEEVISC
jgi:hypothetical protein